MLLGKLHKRHCVGGSCSPCGVRLPKGCNCVLPSLQELISACLIETQIHFEQYRKAALQGEVQML